MFVAVVALGVFVIFAAGMWLVIESSIEAARGTGETEATMKDNGARLKPDGKTFRLKEQIIEDPVSGLTLWIRESGPSWTLTLIGDCLEFGNRDLNFSSEGELVGAGTGLCCPPKASWLKEETAPRAEGLNEYSPNPTRRRR